MRGFSDCDPKTYSDVVTEVRAEWCEARERATSVGMPRHRIWFDPGLGFHKNAKHSHEIMRRLEEFDTLEAPLVLGASRKSFLASADGTSAEERLGGSIAAALRGWSAGAAVLRVHDVAATLQALNLMQTWTASLSVAENEAFSVPSRLKWGTLDV